MAFTTTSLSFSFSRTHLQYLVKKDSPTPQTKKETERVQLDEVWAVLDCKIIIF
jgi:hypothetical protein